MQHISNSNKTSERYMTVFYGTKFTIFKAYFDKKKVLLKLVCQVFCHDGGYS